MDSCQLDIVEKPGGVLLTRRKSTLVAMEILAAVSLASNMIQFIEFGFNIITKGTEIRKSAEGYTVEDAATKKQVDSLRKCLVKLQDPNNLTRPGALDVNTLRYVQELEQACSDVVQNFEKCYSSPSRKKRPGFFLALKRLWANDRVSALKQNMDRLTDDLQVRLLVDICRCFFDGQTKQDAQFKELVSMSKTISERLKVTEESQDPGKTEYSKAKFYINDLESRVFQSLSFLVMHDREASVGPATSGTYQWIFDDEMPTGPSSRFRDWLQSNPAEARAQHSSETASKSNIFWIKGKPGSGKSTLMRHLRNHQETRSSLKKWTDDGKLLLASHFFWYSGTELQKSQEGLMRALLHSCVSARKELIPLIGQELAKCPQDEIDSFWTFKNLRDALMKLLSEESVMLRSKKCVPLRFCFFIDGLDEYEGNPRDLASLIRELSAKPNVKFCVSSRSLTEFETELSGFPTLVLQDYTHPDIDRYINEKFKEISELKSPGLGTLDNPEKIKSDAAKAISNKANGVFLWVVLVMKSLREGVQNGDSIFELKKRIEGFPEDLEELYQSMIKRIGRDYLETGLRCLLLAKAAEGTLTLLLLAVVIKISEPPPVGDPPPVERPKNVSRKNTLDEQRTQLHDKKKCLCNATKLKIQAYCRGLLEVPDSDDLTAPVNFLHTTVADFVRSGKAEELLLKRLTSIGKNPGLQFEPQRQLLRGYLAMLQSLFPEEQETIKRKEWFQQVRPLALEFMDQALIAEKNIKENQEKKRAHVGDITDLIDKMDEIVSGLWAKVTDRSDDEQKNTIEWPWAHLDRTKMACVLAEKISTNYTFHSFAARRGLDLYAKKKIKEPVQYKAPEGFLQRGNDTRSSSFWAAAEEITGSNERVHEEVRAHETMSRDITPKKKSQATAPARSRSQGESTNPTAHSSKGKSREHGSDSKRKHRHQDRPNHQVSQHRAGPSRGHHDTKIRRKRGRYRQSAHQDKSFRNLPYPPRVPIDSQSATSITAMYSSRIDGDGKISAIAGPPRPGWNPRKKPRSFIGRMVVSLLHAIGIK